MAYLTQIVDNINSSLKDKLSAFPTAKYYGVANTIARVKEKSIEYLPAIVSSKGECKLMSLDDVAELIVYHKIISSGYIQEKNRSYGDGYTAFQHNMDIDLVVMANRKKVGITSDSLEAAIASNIPVADKVQGIPYINIYPVSANHNAKSLFTQEFQGIEYFLRPEHILFSIRYRIEVKYTKGCISLCHCD